MDPDHGGGWTRGRGSARGGPVRGRSRSRGGPPRHVDHSGTTQGLTMSRGQVTAQNDAKVVTISSDDDAATAPMTASFSDVANPKRFVTKEDVMQLLREREAFTPRNKKPRQDNSGAHQHHQQQQQLQQQLRGSQKLQGEQAPRQHQQQQPLMGQQKSAPHPPANQRMQSVVCPAEHQNWDAVEVIAATIFRSNALLELHGRYQDFEFSENAKIQSILTALEEVKSSAKVDRDNWHDEAEKIHGDVLKLEQSLQKCDTSGSEFEEHLSTIRSDQKKLTEEIARNNELLKKIQDRVSDIEAKLVVTPPSSSKLKNLRSRLQQTTADLQKSKIDVQAQLSSLHKTRKEYETSLTKQLEANVKVSQASHDKLQEDFANLKRVMEDRLKNLDKTKTD